MSQYEGPPQAFARRVSVAAIRDEHGEAHLAIENEDGSVSIFHSRSNVEDESLYQDSML